MGGANFNITILEEAKNGFHVAPNVSDYKIRKCLLSTVCLCDYTTMRWALLLEQGIDREVSDVPGSVAHFFDASEYKFHIMKDNGKSMQENQ